MISAYFALLALGIYPYAIYPVLAWILASVRPRWPRLDDDFLPSVTVLTAAYNEARHIGASVRNKLAQDYPEHALRVVVVSDASSDDTDRIVDELAAGSGRVTLLRNAHRQGKTAGLNLAMAQISSDIVVIADANSIYRPDTVRKLVRNFADPEVGYVTGRMLYVNADGSLVGDGCSAYMKYENALRAVETRLGSIVGVDGGVDAFRRTLYRPMRADQLPDMVLPLAVVEQGSRVIYEPEAILTEETLGAQSAEYRMRVRVALRAFWAMFDMRGLLNPARRPLFAWQLWSHKVLRYMSFLPLGLACLLGAVMWDAGALFQLIMAGQAAFAVLVGAAAADVPLAGRNALARYAYYFFLLNWASAVAFVRFLRGQKQVLWQPRTG